MSLTVCCLSAPPQDPCNPSPCGRNGQCRVINGIASCVYPECIINQDCPRDKACFNQKCRDPCVDACGINAICQVVNHNAVCSCPPGYVGEPRLQCSIRVEQGNCFILSVCKLAICTNIIENQSNPFAKMYIHKNYV